MSKSNDILQMLEEVNPMKEAAGILFKYANEVFLVKHSISKQWVTPGGMKEAGDKSLADTAIRECREEVGTLPGYVETGKYAITEDDTSGVRYKTFLFEPQDKFAPGALDEETEDAKWFSLDQLPKPLHPGLEAAIKEFKFVKAERPLGWK